MDWRANVPVPARGLWQLVQAVGFAVAVQVRLMGSASSRPEPLAAPPPAEAPLLAEAPPPAKAPPPAIPVDVHRENPASAQQSGVSIAVGAGASVGVGLAPGAIAVARLFGSVAWSRVAVELGAELGVPSTLHRSNGSGFSEQILLGNLAGCWLRSPWSACLVTKVGEIRVSGEGVDFPATSSGVLAQTGLRLAATHMVGRRAQIAARADGLAMVTRGVVTLDSVAVWSAPRVAAEIGIDISVRFP